MKDLQNAARHSIQVQLESRKDLDAAIIERVKKLKTERKFTTTFRDMASLYFSLQDGDTSVLMALFPWLMDAIGAATKSSNSNSGDEKGEAILSKLDALQRSIEAQQPTDNHQAAVAETQPFMMSGNLKSLAGSSKPLPGPEDRDDLADLLEVEDVLSEADGTAAQNLINSMLRVQQVKSDKPDKPSKSVKRERQSLDDMLEIKVVDGE